MFIATHDSASDCSYVVGVPHLCGHKILPKYDSLLYVFTGFCCVRSACS